MTEGGNYGYILRISEDDWEKQVFEIEKYYTAVRRRWHRGTNILLARKKDVGDSFIGYGVVGKVKHLWELSPEEEAYCQENNWKCVRARVGEASSMEHASPRSRQTTPSRLPRSFRDKPKSHRRQIRR